MFKKKNIKTLLIISSITLGVSQPVIAHEFVMSSESAQRSVMNMPSLKASMDTIPYSHLLYGFTLDLEIEGANFSTTDVNTLRSATTISTPNNVVRPYRATDKKVTYRIMGDNELRATNFITMTVDQSVLSVPHSLSITIPVYSDVSPPDTPHENANTVDSLTMSSISADDFLDGSGVVFTMTLNEGEFQPGCADPIAHSIMETSNIRGIVRILNKTKNKVEFIVEGGVNPPMIDNWNFELKPETTTLNQNLHVSSPINS